MEYRNVQVLPATAALLLWILAGPSGRAFAQTNATPTVGPVKVGAAVKPVKTYIDLRTLPKEPLAPFEKAVEVEQAEGESITIPPSAIQQEMEKVPLKVQRKIIDLHPSSLKPGVTAPQFTTPAQNFAGIGYTQIVPADPNGAPGLNHYIQVVNSKFQIFDKVGNSLAGPTNINQLWASQPTSQCFLNNNGDPVVLYDALADRWLISQFANPKSNPSEECVAISQTGNPVAGTWYLYDFTLPYPDDYPKLGVWPDGYYLTTQQGFGGGPINVAVLDRANMLNGNPATFQSISISGSPDGILLPGDLNGPPPPLGTPNPLARAMDGTIYGGSDRIEIWEFHVDWGDPTESTLINTASLSTDPFSSPLCVAGNLFDNCVPQPNTTNTLEALDVWSMGPLEYRNFGDHETLVFNHTVNATPSTFPNGQAGVHWYEVRRNAGTWSIYQESTFAPDGTSRWMGSVAMDQAGDMAAGYSFSDANTLFPSIRYVGRLATDPLNEMTTPETVLIAGNNSQIANGNRWGDYSAMRVDPVDGCTFWYTTMYATGSVVPDNSAAWGTQIGSFRFPTCNPADLSITKSGPASVVAGGLLNYTLTVTNHGPSTATNVVVIDQLPGDNLSFINDSLGACIPSGNPITLTCALGTMANGQTITFTVQTQVPANALSIFGINTFTLTNNASVSADQLDPNTSNNSASATTVITESADLMLTKTCKPDTTSAPAGSTAVCSIKVTNLGTSDAQNAVITDTILSSIPFTVSSVSVSSGFCSPTSITTPVTSATLTCTIGTVAAGSGMTMIVAFSAASGGNIDDTASVAATTPDPNNSNNFGSGAVTFVSSADLSITKTVSPSPVVAGTNVTYVITVNNAGPSAATNVVATDTIPAQVSVLTVTPSQGSCTAGISGNPLQPLTCTLGTMNVSSSATIVVVGKVASNVPSNTVVNNNASVSSAVADPNNGNNSATAAVTVVTSADLAVVKTSDKATYKPSSTVIYTITVTNLGPSDSQAVVVTDNLPNVSQAIYKSDTGGCVKNANTPTVLTCSLGTMPVGTTKSFSIYERVNGSRGTISNTASATSTSAPPTPDPNLTNNTSVRVVTIGH